MSGAYALVFILSASLEMATPGPSAERVVYPRLLQARGTNGEMLLHIQDGLTLSLEKSSVLAENFILTTLEGDNQIHTTMNGKELEKNVYHDRHQAAAVTVEEKDGSIEVRGALGNTLRIAPLPLSARSEDGIMAHKLFEIEERGDFRSDYVVPPHLMAEERFIQLRRRNAKVPENFTVEMAVLCDMYYTKEFKDGDEIVLYLATLFTLVNLRYVDTSDPFVQFILVQVFLSKGVDPVTVTMLEHDVERPTLKKRYMVSEQTLENLAEAVKLGRINSSADMVLLLTSLDLADKNGSTVENQVLGIAYVGGVCSTGLRAALAEDYPHTYHTVGVTTHELSHALGSTHDGSLPRYATLGAKPRICDSGDGYIMSPVAGGANSGVFSPCSLAQMSAFAGTLSSDCFKIASARNYTTYIKQLPRDKMTKSEYCQRLHRNYDGVTSEEDPMLSARCKLACCPRTRLLCFVDQMADGMSCGDGKYCLRSVCAAPGGHPTAPPRRSTTRPTTTAATTTNRRWFFNRRTRFLRARA